MNGEHCGIVELEVNPFEKIRAASPVICARNARTYSEMPPHTYRHTHTRMAPTPAFNFN